MRPKRALESENKVDPQKIESEKPDAQKTKALESEKAETEKSDLQKIKVGLLTGTRLPPSLDGVAVAHAGSLVYREDDDTSFYLSQDDFKEIVQDAGGKFGSSITGKTTIVVLGALEKEWSSKEPDLWTGSGKEKALTKQKTIGTGPHVVTLERFIEFYDDKYSLRREVESNVNVACFKGANQPPHKRSKGHFFSRTLYWNKQPGEDPQSKSRNVKGINRMGGHPMEEYYDCW